MPKRLAILLSITMMPVISFAESLIDEGQYIAQLANCYACHTDTENDGTAFAGGRAMETDFGTFYSPNITPHMETGIGRWNDQNFTRAVRNGLAPDGSHYYPAFPYESYKNISDEDIRALKAYMDSLKPVKQQNKQHELKWYISRQGVAVWKTLNRFVNSSENLNSTRGRYLVETLGHCHECHTPRNSLGILKMSQQLTGNKALSAPDISAQKLRDWKTVELEELFLDGVLPDGDYVSDHMAEVVEYSTTHWKPEDLKAAIRYLTRP